MTEIPHNRVHFSLRLSAAYEALGNKTFQDNKIPANSIRAEGENQEQGTRQVITLFEGYCSGPQLVKAMSSLREAVGSDEELHLQIILKKTNPPHQGRSIIRKNSNN